MREMHSDVWAWRETVQSWFPTPGCWDCMYFAVTEAAEAVEAYLRQNSGYKRRYDDKEHVEPREWTQCAMMLLSGIGPVWDLDGKWESLAVIPTRDSLVFHTSMALWHMGTNGREVAAATTFAIGQYLADRFFTGLRGALTNEMLRLAEAHRPIHVPSAYAGRSLHRVVDDQSDSVFVARDHTQG